MELTVGPTEAQGRGRWELSLCANHGLSPVKKKVPNKLRMPGGPEECYLDRVEVVVFGESPTASLNHTGVTTY